MTDIINFPIFPLQLVLVPGELLPLHIFEERYKTMINECLEQKSQFGIVWWKDSGLSPIGCTAQIVDVSRRYSDGRMDIVTVGRRRFRINSTSDVSPYLQGQISYFYDQTEIPDSSLVERAIKSHLDYLRMINAEIPMDQYRQNVERNTSYFISATSGLSLLDKQVLLEVTSENERLKRLIQYLEENNRIVHQTQNIWNVKGEA